MCPWAELLTLPIDLDKGLAQSAEFRGGTDAQKSATKNENRRKAEIQHVQPKQGSSR